MLVVSEYSQIYENGAVTNPPTEVGGQYSLGDNESADLAQTSTAPTVKWED
jgi:hypothetical protein